MTIPLAYVNALARLADGKPASEQPKSVVRHLGALETAGFASRSDEGGWARTPEGLDALTRAPGVVPTGKTFTRRRLGCTVTFEYRLPTSSKGEKAIVLAHSAASAHVHVVAGKVKKLVPEATFMFNGGPGSFAVIFTVTFDDCPGLPNGPTHRALLAQLGEAASTAMEETRWLRSDRGEL